MSKLTILDNESITVWYHIESKIVHHKFHKFTNGKPFRNGLNKGYEILRDYNASKWLSDDRNNSTLPPDDYLWSTNDWFPRMVNAGWKYWAVVLPEDAIGKLNMNRFIKEYSRKGIITGVFDNPDEALLWIEKFQITKDIFQE